MIFFSLLVPHWFVVCSIIHPCVSRVFTRLCKLAHRAEHCIFACGKVEEKLKVHNVSVGFQHKNFTYFQFTSQVPATDKRIWFYFHFFVFVQLTPAAFCLRPNGTVFSHLQFTLCGPHSMRTSFVCVCIAFQNVIDSCTRANLTHIWACALSVYSSRNFFFSLCTCHILDLLTIPIVVLLWNGIVYFCPFMLDWYVICSILHSCASPRLLLAYPYALLFLSCCPWSSTQCTLQLSFFYIPMAWFSEVICIPAYPIGGSALLFQDN